MPYTGSCANNRRRIENDTGAATSLVSSHKPVMDKALYGQKGMINDEDAKDHRMIFVQHWQRDSNRLWQIRALHQGLR